MGALFSKGRNFLVHEEYSRQARKSVKFGGQNVAWTVLLSLAGASPPASSASFLPILKCVDYIRLLPIICDFFLFYACVPVLIKYRETKRKRAQTLFPPI